MLRDSSNDVFTLKAKEDIVIQYNVPPNNSLSKKFSKGTVFYGKRWPYGKTPIESVMKTTPDGTAPDWNVMGTPWIDVPMDNVEVVSIKADTRKINQELKIGDKFWDKKYSAYLGPAIPNKYGVITEEDRKRYRENSNNPYFQQPTTSIVNPNDPRFQTPTQGKPLPEKKPIGLVIGGVLVLAALYLLHDKKPA